MLFFSIFSRGPSFCSPLFLLISFPSSFSSPSFSSFSSPLEASSGNARGQQPLTASGFDSWFIYKRPFICLWPVKRDSRFPRHSIRSTFHTDEEARFLVDFPDFPLSFYGRRSMNRRLDLASFDGSKTRSRENPLLRRF